MILLCSNYAKCYLVLDKYCISRGCFRPGKVRPKTTFLTNQSKPINICLEYYNKTAISDENSCPSGHELFKINEKLEKYRVNKGWQNSLE